MQPEQRIIADWLLRVRKKTGWNWDQWAEAAGLGSATTISRAVKDDYGSVTKIETLHKLAKAAGEPSPLEFLASDQAVRAADSAPAISAEALTALLAALLPLQPKGRQTAQSLRVLAAALQHGLELLGEDAANPEPRALGVAARGAVARLRDLLQ